MHEAFGQKKKEISEGLTTLAECISKLKDRYGFEANDVLKKLSAARQHLRQEVFSLALFGAFSDGKSSVISALTGRTDIKVATDPNTAEVTAYEYGDLQIIDTPGLFSDRLLHDDISSKYISEANMVLYTVDPVNPLPESQHNVVKWLIRDIAKADATLFVLNKMDEIADLEEDADFKLNVEIKTAEIKKTVALACGEEGVDVQVVGVSANPYDRGLEYWFKEETTYRELSHIDDLRSAVELFVAKARDGLILAASISAARDAVLTIVGTVSRAQIALEKQIHLSICQLDESRDQLDGFNRRIGKTYVAVKEEVLQLREDTLLGIDGAVDARSLQSILKIQLGMKGEILQQRIDLILQKHTETLVNTQSDLARDLDESLSKYNEASRTLLKEAVKLGGQFGQKLSGTSSRKLANLILKTRDALRIPFKFKPWGALKWGKSLLKFGKFLKGLPILIESLDVIVKVFTEIKLEKEKSKVSTQVQGLFTEFLDSLTMDAYQSEYFPFIDQYRSMFDELSKQVKNQQAMLSDITEMSTTMHGMVEDIECIFKS